MVFAQAAHGVGLLGRQNQELICSIGGETAENGGGMLGQVQCRTLDNGRWQVMGEMPEPRHGLGVLSLNGQLYAIGGARQPGLTQTSPRLDRPQPDPIDPQTLRRSRLSPRARGCSAPPPT